MAQVILTRLGMMLIYMIPGYSLYKAKLLTDTGSKELARLLLYVILPAAIIRSYHMAYSAQMAMGLLISFLLAVVALAVSVLLSRLCFRGEQNAIENFSAAFSNAGFMGIPLVSAVIGSEAVCYGASFVAMLNIMQWTYGVFLITGDKKAIAPKKILGNPIIISFVIGVVLFLLPVQLPVFFTELLDGIAAMNAPIAMAVMGIYLAQVPLKALFSGWQGYAVSVVRLAVIPLITAVLLAVIPLGSYQMKLSMLIFAAAPVGSNVAVYAQLYGKDYRKAVKEVVLSTLLCIVTMPLIIAFGEFLLERFPG